MFFQYCGEFDNWGAIMSVSAELLCSFELLKPLDSSALKSHIKKGRNKRNSILNSPVGFLSTYLDIENVAAHPLCSLLRCQLKVTSFDGFGL